MRFFVCLFISLSFFIYSCQNNEKPVFDENASQNDTNKVIELLILVNNNVISNPKFAKEKGNEAITLAQSIGYKKGYVNGLLNLGQVYLKGNEYVMAKRYFMSALMYLKENELILLEPKCLGSLGIVSERLCNYPESINYYESCRKAFTKINDTVGVIKSQINIGNVYNALGNTSKAVSVLLEAIRMSELINNENVKGVCLNNLSTLYQEMGKNDEALKSFFIVSEITIKSADSSGLANAYNNIGITYQSLKNNDLSLKYYLKSAEIRQVMNDKTGLAISFNNIGSLRYDAKDYKSALDYFKKAYEITEETQDLLPSSKYLKNISDAYSKLGKYNEAIDCLNQSLSIANKIGASSEKSTTLNALSEVYIQTNDYELAYNYFKAYSLYNDSLNVLENNKAIEEMKGLYESEKKEQQITKLESEKQSAKLTNILLYGFAVMLVIIGGLIFLWQRNKSIKNRQNAEYRQSLIEEKLTVAKLEQHNLKQELQYKEKELVNMALYIIQKIEFIELLNNELKTLQKESKEEKNEVVNKLSQLISANVKLDKERLDFQLHVENVNQSFFIKLKEKFPGITENEKKLSALLRINLSSKDIASIYNISPSSVDMNRYRLRKKLNLNSDENLGEFLNNI
jgi:tetratricopeptide (TPR) repeat protein